MTTTPTKPSGGFALATEAMNDINTVVVGTAPSEAQGITYEALAHSLTLLLHNAAQTQFGSKQVETAAVAAVCAQIIKAGASGAGSRP